MLHRLLSLLSVLALLSGCGNSETPTEEPETPTKTESKTTQENDQPVQTENPLVARAELHLTKQEYELAIETLSHVIASNPDNSEAYLKRATAYAGMKQDANALADFSTCIRLDRHNPKLLNARGYFLLLRQHLPEAIDDFTAAIKLDEKFAEPYNNRGLARVARKEYAQAVADFDAALKLKPDYLAALNNRGFAYMQQKDIQKAFKDFDAALQLDPKSVTAYNNRGLTWYHAGKYEQAVQDFTAAIELEPNSVKYFTHRRDAWLKLGRNQEAQADKDRIVWIQRLNQLNQVIATQPLQPLPYLMRGEHAAAAGDIQQASADFHKALELNPMFARAHVGLGGLALKQQKYEEALKECNEAIRLEASQEAYSARGDAYANLQQYEQAVADYAQARRFDPSVARVYLKWSEQLRRNGKTEQAEQAYQRALELDPSLATTSGE